MTKYIVVSGDRNYQDIKVIENTFNDISKTYPTDEYQFIHGGCKGADLLANSVAKMYNYNTIEFKADWGKYGLGAGPIRNSEMLKMNPELVLIFHNNLESSKGTRSFITLLNKKKNYNPVIMLNGEKIDKLII